MALRNVLLKGSYTTLSVLYDKRDRMISILASVFVAETDAKPLTTIPVRYQSVRTAYKIASVLVTAANLPVSPKTGDEIFAPEPLIITTPGTDNTHPSSLTLQASVLRWNGSDWNELHHDSIYDGVSFWKRDGNHYIKDQAPDNDIWWDSQFGINKIHEFKDQYAFAYSWLKNNHPAFADAEDC